MAATPRADFYLVSASDERTRLRTACRLAEKAYDQGLSVTVLARNPAEATAFDEMLWTFSDRAFVPHGLCPAEETVAEATPVLISSGELPASHHDVLINLGAEVPDDFVAYGRICEVVASDKRSRGDARKRWRLYRDAGVAPNSHELSGG